MTQKILNYIAIIIVVVLGLLGASIVRSYGRQVADSLEVPDLKLCSLTVVDCGVYEPIQLAQRGVRGIAYGRARLTQYNWTGYPMANGEYPYLGAVAISDRAIPLGSMFVIDGCSFEVKDRTALWVHSKFGTTIDIYSEQPREILLDIGRIPIVL